MTCCGNNPRRRHLPGVAVIAVACMWVVPAGAQAPSPISGILREVGIDQKLNEQVPLDLEFRDEGGKPVRLGSYFGKRPVVLTLVYYQCPLLCNQVLNGLLKSSQAVPFTVGNDYDIVTVSIDPRETPQLAAKKKETYVRQYRRAGAEQGWHFLTGDQGSIEALTQAAGFRYCYDETSGQFAHASGILLLTPEGRISRYFYGIDYPPGDLRLGLVESSANRIGSPVDQILLLCYHYDPMTGRYGLVVAGALRIAGLATIACLAAFLWVSFRRERRLPRLTAAEPAAAATIAVGASELSPGAMSAEIGPGDQQPSAGRRVEP